MSDSCIFCRIVRGEIPSYKVYEDEHVLGILDAFPAADGHTLVIPKKHAAQLWDASHEDLSKCMGILQIVGEKITQLPGVTGINLLQNNGKSAGQDVHHVHFHLIPRHDDDDLCRLPKSGPMIESTKAQSLLASLKVVL
eukprot:ANDGO_06788.mRNA.1 putative HIT-like protein MJ0866